MKDIERMQKLLEDVLTRITELEERVGELKKDPGALSELRSVKAKLATQQRVKITLIQSIQELTPSSNTMTIFSPLKSSKAIINRIASLFRS
jgi:hypothetical protein